VNARTAVFLDRDGVINELFPDPVTGRSESPLHPQQVRLIPGAAPAIVRLRHAGWLLVGVSNQPAAAKGTVSLEEIYAVHERVVALLAAEGAALDAFRFCLHHPDGVVPALAGECSCRKPAPGLLLQAASDLSIDLRASWMIGDTDSDVLAGQSAGCQTVLVQHRESAHKTSGQVTPDIVVPDLHAAANALLVAADRVN
jgi:D-glycero-D-manno-heptose 1,7-bisphosphate phosphatase